MANPEHLERLLSGVDACPMPRRRCSTRLIPTAR